MVSLTGQSTLSFCTLLALIFAIFYTENVYALTEEQIGQLEELVENYFVSDDLSPGMSISVVQGDNFDQVFSRGYGVRDIENQIKADNETLFGVGSLSKMISALYITKLLNDKRPDLGEDVLDTPIRVLAPEFDFTLIDRYRSEYVTFRDLLSHKVCVDTLTEYIGLLGGIESKADGVYRQRYMPETCNFRAPVWSYNNAMIHVAAEAAAAVHGTGESFEDLITKFLNEELLMKHTRLIRPDDIFEEFPNFAKPYYHPEDKYEPLNPNLLKRIAISPAAGGILTTSNDMAHFMAVLGNYGRRMDGTQAVSEEVMYWIARTSNPFLYSPAKEYEGDRPSGYTGYGIGLILGVNDGWQTLGHIGYYSPYSATATVYPQYKLGIFTSSGGYAGHGQLHDEMFDIVRGISQRKKTAKQIDTRKKQADMFRTYPNLTAIAKHLGGRPAVETPTPENTRRIDHSVIVGEYGLGFVGTVNITNVDETTLYLSYGTGEWFTGPLTARVDTPAIYDGIVDTDLVQDFGTIEFSVDFSLLGIAGITYDGTTFPFIKGFTIGDLPVTPWAPDSCGVESS